VLISYVGSIEAMLTFVVRTLIGRVWEQQIAPQLRRVKETNVQLASMPWDSIVMSMATILMFSILLAALAWGVHQSGGSPSTSRNRPLE